jgi:cell wall-associated NlpC family hydrolase
VFVVVTGAQPSLDEAIRAQIARDVRQLQHVRGRVRLLQERAQRLQAKLKTATDPFEYEDAAAAVDTTLGSARARARGLRSVIRRLHAALTPIQLPTEPTRTTSAGLGWDAVAVAEHYLGVRYLWGGVDPGSGFDCSGFVKFVYARLGLTLPHYAATQFETTPRIDPAGLEAGDLIFFEPHADGPGHVGIYVGEGQLIEAPRTGDVVKLAPVASLTAALGFVGATRPVLLLH